MKADHPYPSSLPGEPVGNDPNAAAQESGESLPESAPDLLADSTKGEGVGLSDKIRAAVVWRSGSQILAQLISWTTTLVVVRLLVPADYGLFAMTQVVMGLLAFLNGYGFASALVAEKEVTPFRIRQAFGLLILMNLAVAMAQLALAPVAASYYGQPVIADMLRIQALMTLSTPFIAVPEALMGRQLDFRRQALVNLAAASVAALLSVIMAWRGYGVWTLVIAPIAGFWLRAIGLALATRWLVWPSFNLKGTGGIAAYGSTILLIQLCWLVQTQSDIFFAGRRYPPHEIGLYSEALFLAMIFSAKFVPPLNEVAFPAYARLRDDAEEMRRAFVKAARLILAIGLPIYLGIAASAEPLIATLFGEKWGGIVPLIVPIALGLPFLTLQILFGPALNAMGRQLVTLKLSAFGAALFALMFFFASHVSMMRMAQVWLVGSPLYLVMTVLMARPHLGVRIADLASALWRPALASAVMAVTVWLADVELIAPLGWAAPLRLVVLVGIGAVTYAALMWLVARELVEEAASQLRLSRGSVRAG